LFLFYYFLIISKSLIFFILPSNLLNH